MIFILKQSALNCTFYFTKVIVAGSITGRVCSPVYIVVVRQVAHTIVHPDLGGIGVMAGKNVKRAIVIDVGHVVALHENAAVVQVRPTVGLPSTCHLQQVDPIKISSAEEILMSIAIHITHGHPPLH